MKVKQKLGLVILCCVVLCACQSTTPNIDDKTSYSLAVNTRDGMQRTKLVPVPVPGQLMSIHKTKSSNRLEGEAAIEAANKKSIKQPNSGEYINSIMTFDYMPGALYQIYSAPLSVTDIQFQPNEHIIAVGAGDTTRWQVSKTYSGIGANRQEHLLVKPVDEALNNSIVVTTDQRTYHLMLHSTPKTYMASVTWRYPDSDNLVTKYDDDPDSSVSSGVDVGHMNFNYAIKQIKGSKPDWYPRAVFNDGNKTYIKFSGSVQDTPSLFVGTNKKPEIVNYRVQGNYYIVDGILYQAFLRGGVDNKTILQITMKK